MRKSDHRHGGVAVDHSGQLPRLRRIEGQVRGLQQMIEDGRYCVEVAQQINSMRSQELALAQSRLLNERALIEADLATAHCRRDKLEIRKIL